MCYSFTGPATAAKVVVARQLRHSEYSGIFSRNREVFLLNYGSDFRRFDLLLNEFQEIWLRHSKGLPSLNRMVKGSTMLPAKARFCSMRGPRRRKRYISKSSGSFTTDTESSNPLLSVIMESAICGCSPGQFDKSRPGFISGRSPILVCTLRSRPKSCNLVENPITSMRWKTRTPIPITRIISAREVSRLAALIDPAKVVAGGRSDPVARYLDPTILHLVNWEDRLMEEEIFRPILPILTYRTQPLVQLAQRN
jgi:hypothetical protein